MKTTITSLAFMALTTRAMAHGVHEPVSDNMHALVHAGPVISIVVIAAVGFFLWKRT